MLRPVSMPLLSRSGREAPDAESRRADRWLACARRWRPVPALPAGLARHALARVKAALRGFVEREAEVAAGIARFVVVGRYPARREYDGV